MTRFGLVRLFLSYQRYSALLFVAATLLALATWSLWFRGGLLFKVASLLCGIAALSTARFGTFVAARFPQKLRATRLHSRRIEQGRFSPAKMKSYCSDPCFRVVANELLRRSGMSSTERRATIRRFKANAREPEFLVFYDASVPSGVTTKQNVAPSPSNLSTL